MSTWTYSAPDGTYKNHFMSRNIRMSAVANSKFMPYAQPEKGYGKGKGDTVNITRVFDLPLATRVSEDERLPVGRPTVDTVDVTVSEWGFEIELTEFERDLTYYDIQNRFQQRLRDQIRLTCDKMCADAAKLTEQKAVATTSASITFESVVGGGAPTGATATTNLNIRHLKDIKDMMSGTMLVPPFGDDYYVGILSTQAARGIKNDPEFRDWYAPSGKNEFIKGHLGDVEGFHLIETNHTASLSNDVSSTGCGEAVFFGMDPFYLAEVRTPELRRGIPQGLGRFIPFGWVGTLEAGNAWPEVATGRTVHLTSK